MTAREEFPIDREQPPVRYTIDPGVWHDMCDLIDHLRARVGALESAVTHLVTGIDDDEPIAETAP